MATKAGTQNGSQGSVIPPQAFSHEGVEVLHRLVHAASEAATREALLGRAVKTLVDHNEWSWGAVWAQSDGRWKKGPSAGRLGAQLARHDNLPTTASGLLGEAAQHRSFVFYSALTQGPQDCALCSTAAREGAASGLAIPLAIGDQVHTVLALFSRHERNDEDWNRSTWESVGTLLATTLSLRAELGERAAEIEAISRAQAVVEFNLEGEVLAANENFLASVGYSLAEVKGKHHKTFVAPAPSPRVTQKE